MKYPFALVLPATLMVGGGLGWILCSTLTSSSSSYSSSSPAVMVTTRTTPGERSDATAGGTRRIEVEIKGGGLEAVRTFIREYRKGEPAADHNRQMILLSESLNSADFPEVMALLSDTNQNRNRPMIQSFFAAWVAKDSSAARKWLAGKVPSNPAFGNLAYTLLNHLAAVDITAAQRWLEDNDQLPNHDYLFTIVSGRMAEDDPGKAIDFIQSRNLNQNASRNAYTAIYKSWANKEPRAALASLGSLDRADLRREIQKNILSQWYRQDPDASLTAIDSLPDEHARARAYHDIIWQLSNDDPARAKQILAHIPAGKERSQMVSIIARQMGRDNPRQALEWIGRQQDFAGRNSALSNVISEWAGKEPVAALQYAFNLPNSNARDGAIRSSFRKYMDSEPAAALQWIESLDDASTRSRLLRNHAYDIGRQMPAEGLRLAQLISPGYEQRNFYTSILSGWSKAQPEHAVEWFHTHVTDPELTEALSTTIAANLLEQSPEKAVAFAGQLPPASHDKTIAFIASSLSNYDINSAISLTAQIKDEKARTSAVSRVISKWSRNDPEGASRWLRQLPEGQMRDQSINSFVSQIQQHEPEAATLWASSISDENQRRNSIRQSAVKWLRIDPQAATAWIESTQALDNNLRKELLQSTN